MQHIRHGVVLHVLAFSRALGRHIRSQQRLADDRVGRRIFQRRLGVNLKIEPPAANQFADADARPARRRANYAARNGELAHRTLQLRRSEVENGLPRRRGCLTHVYPAARNPCAAACSAVIRHQRRVAFDDRDALDRNAEFFGGHLAHGDAQTGADIHLAGVNGD